MLGRRPLRQWGKPETLIGTVVLLVLSASDYVNGEIIYVDGGMLAVPCDRAHSAIAEVQRQ